MPQWLELSGMVICNVIFGHKKWIEWPWLAYPVTSSSPGVGFLTGLCIKTDSFGGWGCVKDKTRKLVLSWVAPSTGKHPHLLNQVRPPCSCPGLLKSFVFASPVIYVCFARFSLFEKLSLYILEEFFLHKITFLHLVLTFKCKYLGKKMDEWWMVGG